MCNLLIVTFSMSPNTHLSADDISTDDTVLIADKQSKDTYIMTPNQMIRKDERNNAILWNGEKEFVCWDFETALSLPFLENPYSSGFHNIFTHVSDSVISLLLPTLNFC